MANTKNRTTRVQDEDTVIYRIMVAMVIVAAVICGLIFLYYRYQKMTYFLYIYEAVFYGAIGGAVGAVVCFVAGLLVRSRPKARKVLLTVAACLLILAVCCVVMRVHVWEGIVWLFIAFPAGLVLYILYLIYQPEFFVMALQSAVSGIGFFVLYQMGATMLRPWTIAILAVFLVCTTALIALAGGDGQLSVAGLRLRLFQEPKSRRLELVTAALCILGLVVTVLAGGLWALVSAGVVLAWLIVMACYYTVKLV